MIILSKLSKAKKSRESWKNKAVDRGNMARRLRAENARVKKERDMFKAKAKEAQKEIEELKAAVGTPALKGKSDVAYVCFLLFCVAGLGFRAVSRVLGVLGGFLGLKKTPCPQTIVNWVASLSIARIQIATQLHNHPDSPGFVWMIDASIGHGAGKILAVLALRADHHFFNDRAPTLMDARCVSVKVSGSWTGESVADFLLETINAVGPPLAILKDGGTDLAKAARILGERGLAIPTIDDISHFAANLLKKEYGKHPMLPQFLAACGAASKKLKQTILACLAPPKISIKARFMNLGRLVEWADKILKHSPKGRAAKGSMLEKLRKCLEGLPGCKRFIEQFFRNASALAKIQEILKNRGLSGETVEECRGILQESVAPSSTVRIGMMNWLDRHLAIAKELGLADAGVPITSDSIESLFGLAKARGTGPVKDANRIAARLPAFCGPTTMEDVEAALKVSVNERERILECGPSLIKQRRKVLPNPSALESLATDLPEIGLTLIPDAKNRRKNQNTAIDSNGFNESTGSDGGRDQEAIFPANGLSPLFPARG